MSGLILLATFSSQLQLDELRARLSQVDLERSRMADQFKESLREVHNSMLRYASEPDPALWENFLGSAHRLRAWIDGQKAKLTSKPESVLLKRIDAAYDDYLRTARGLSEKLQASGSHSASLSEFNPMRTCSQHLFDLGQGLAESHYQARDQLLAHANQTLTRLRWLVVGSLLSLLIFAVGLAWMVYRNMIAPLRLKLVASQAMAEQHEKMASLGMLAAGVAHEIRNPLTAIKSALFILSKRFRPGTPEEADAKLVEREILRLDKIVSDFLLFARPAEPELATLPATQPLHEVQQLLSADLQKADIQLSVEPGPTMSIRADPSQIKQVLINLVQNAADSIGQHGAIKLRARSDRKRLTNGETEVVVLEVADSGKGIPTQVRSRLFDPFFSTKEQGTGLGLSIAARIVEKHGGAIQYQTQLNHGTSFGVVLPRAV